jgi:uncharacterized membrane protein (DUF4010 family)
MWAMSFDLLEPHVVALAIGLLIGFGRERQARAAGGDAVTAAGVRTLALVALLGSLAARLGEAAVVAGFVAVAAVVVAGYVATRASDPGTTGELATLVTYVLGALAWSSPAHAAALGVVVAVLLEAKQQLHRFTTLVTQAEVDGALQFLVAAFVVLPLLPDRPVGPGQLVEPAAVWRLVVLITGIGWVGHVATRWLGDRRGLLVTGAAGGFVSGAMTTAAMGRASRSAGVSAALAGALLASVATLVQLSVVVAMTSPGSLLGAVLAGAGASAVVLLVETAIVAVRRHPSERAAAGTSLRPVGAAAVGAAGDTGEAAPVGLRPFAFGPAIALAALMTGVIVAVATVADVAGEGAGALLSTVAGFADVHGPAAGVATLVDAGGLGTSAGVWAIGGALAANTVTKLVLAFAAGGRRFGLPLALAFVAPAVAFAAGAAAFSALA